MKILIKGLVCTLLSFEWNLAKCERPTDWRYWSFGRFKGMESEVVYKVAWETIVEDAEW